MKFRIVQIFEFVQLASKRKENCGKDNIWFLFLFNPDQYYGWRKYY